MSMSQAEIEALMSGAEAIEPDEIEESPVEEEVAQEDVEETHETNEEIESVEDIDNSDIGDILAGIDGIVDDGSELDEEPSIEDISEPEEVPNIEDISEPKEEEKQESIEDLINSNQYPLPVKSENKVVNQLNEVADDSEEKASQIFDVLSFILDENNEVQNYNKRMGEFITKQIELLDALSKKFPNIDVFNENFETARDLVEVSQNLSAKVDGENNKIFEAMELMQYHDINRQKIERVMAVIRKLNSYLNGIFEDENGKPEVQIAKHISGDSNDVVDAEDIESLISEFSSKG